MCLLLLLLSIGLVCLFLDRFSHNFVVSHYKHKSMKPYIILLRQVLDGKDKKRNSFAHSAIIRDSKWHAFNFRWIDVNIYSTSGYLCCLFFFISVPRQNIISPFALRSLVYLQHTPAVENKWFPNALIDENKYEYIYGYGLWMDINLFLFVRLFFFYCDRFVIYLLYSIIGDDNNRSNKLRN